MTKKKNNFTKVPLTEEQIENIRMDLEMAKITFEDDKMVMEDLVEKLELQIPNKQTNEMIDKLEKWVKNKKGKDAQGNEQDLTEMDVLEFKLTIKKLKKQLELDLPTRRLRLQINSMRRKMARLDYPGNQIKKLEKQIREKYAEVYEEKAPDGSYYG